MIDWIRTLKPRLAPQPDPAPEAAEGDDRRAQRAADLAALGHARQRWATTRDEAWLVAALSLASPDSPDAASLVADAERVSPKAPAWLTVQYHSLRLTLATGDAAVLRQRLDSLLARGDLSMTDRNLFTAQRSQVAADLAEFGRYALRQRLCARVDYDQPDPCVRERWFENAIPSGIFDEDGAKGRRGLGEDARATIDRMPLATRLALAGSAELPAKFKLDLSLTNFARAVQIQDAAALDASARDLVVLLPQMAAEWRAVIAAKTGADKRFAQFLVLAKLPGLRVDLVDYSRPQGSTVAQFPGTWVDWIIPAKDRPPGGSAPGLAQYQQDGFGVQTDEADSLTDLTCLGECGRGVAPLRIPAFAVAGQAQAARERAYLFSAEHDYDKPPPPVPPGAVAAWDEMLAYVQAHPKDPRGPEALYWLVRVGRWGGTHERSGQRAFKLLKARYPATSWARRSPYYYD